MRRRDKRGGPGVPDDSRGLVVCIDGFPGDRLALPFPSKECRRGYPSLSRRGGRQAAPTAGGGRALSAAPLFSLSCYPDKPSRPCGNCSCRRALTRKRVPRRTGIRVRERDQSGNVYALLLRPRHCARTASGEKSDRRRNPDVPKRLPAAAKSVPRLRKELSAEAVGRKDEAIRISAVLSLRESINRIEAAVAGQRFGRNTVRKKPRWGGGRQRRRTFRSVQRLGAWGSAQTCACLPPIRRSCGRGPPLPALISTTRASQASRYP